jgi:energy-coupling factor transporter ATP-binding protein EcfA2
MTASTPIYSMQGGQHLLVFSEELIDIWIDRIYTDSHYETKGEITVKSRRPGETGTLHRGARVNLTSTAARKTLARFLDDRLPSLDWVSIVDLACAHTLDGERQGEPPVAVKDMVLGTQASYRLAPVLRNNAPTLLYGPPGSGKTTIAQLMAMLVDAGQQFHTWTPSIGRVLYLDYEDEPDEFLERMQALYKFIGPNVECNIMYRRCYAPVAAELEKLQALVIEHQIDMLVIDSAGAAVGGNPLDHEATIRYFLALRTIGCTSITIGHEPKNSNSKTPFGSQYWLAYPRTIYHVVGQRDNDSPDLHVALYHAKQNRGQLLGPQGLKFTFQEDKTLVFWEDVQQVPELAKHTSWADQIEGVLGRIGSASVSDIAERLEATDKIPTIRATLHQNKRRFIQVGGEWGVLGHDE